MPSSLRSKQTRKSSYVFLPAKTGHPPAEREKRPPAPRSPRRLRETSLLFFRGQTAWTSLFQPSRPAEWTVLPFQGKDLPAGIKNLRRTLPPALSTRSDPVFPPFRPPTEGSRCQKSSVPTSQVFLRSQRSEAGRQTTPPFSRATRQ